MSLHEAAVFPFKISWTEIRAHGTAQLDSECAANTTRPGHVGFAGHTWTIWPTHGPWA